MFDDHYEPLKTDETVRRPCGWPMSWKSTAPIAYWNDGAAQP